MPVRPTSSLPAFRIYPGSCAALLLCSLLVVIGGQLRVAPAAVAATTPGAAPVGSTSYAVPSGAIFAVPGGYAGGSGTQSSPYTRAQTAIDRAPSGSTIVLRGGLYRESLSIPFGKKLTIQSYPGEGVWLDGSGPVTGWTKSGSVWTVPWSYIFDNRASLTPGADEYSRFVDPAYPLAAYPDAVWVDGAEQRQVASLSAVVAGTFYVDRANKRMYLGTDPTGKTVEASKLTKALRIQGAGSTIRGIGVRRYATPVSGKGAVTYEVNDLTFENVVVADNATIGFFGWGDRATFRNVTISGNGLLGLHGDSAPGMQIVSSLIKDNNDQRFRETPVSAGVKLTNAEGVTVRDSVVAGNKTTGLWFDVSMRRVTVVRNRITDNGAAGLEFELSGRAVFADNYLARNKSGLFLFNANDVQVWNNTFDQNRRTIQVLQDGRRQPDSNLAATVPWITSDIDVRNNVLVYGSDFCPVLSQDLTKKWYGANFDIVSNGNVYHRVSSGNPSRFVCWANGSAGTTSFSSFSTWQNATGNDRASKAYEGAAIVSSAGALTSTVLSQTGSVPLPLPTDVAAAIGRPAGERTLGAYLVR